MKLNLQDAGLLKTQAYINGEWVNGADKQTFSVNDPATGDLIANVASLGAQETRAAIEAADAAMKSWKAQSPNTRSEILERWHQLILAHQEDLAIIMTAEQGKPLFESRGEVLYGAAYIKWFAE